jgi:hypothetical protein
MRAGFMAYMAGERDEPWEPWIGAPAMTLAAFAIENLLKGLAITKDPTLVQPTPSDPDELLDQALRTHRLRRLAELARTAVSDAEQELLETLTDFVRWAGRYPFPLRAKDSAPRPGAEGGGTVVSGAWGPAIDALSSRLRTELLEAADVRAHEVKRADAEEASRKRVATLNSLESLRKLEVEPGVTVFRQTFPRSPRTSSSALPARQRCI